MLGRQMSKNIDLYDPQTSTPVFEYRQALIRATIESHDDSCQRPKGIPAFLPKYPGYDNSSHRNANTSSSSKFLTSW